MILILRVYLQPHILPFAAIVADQSWPGWG
jgi:hypothetical protein